MALAHDVRDAAHALRRSAGFTAVAIVTLGLGIGATTAIFSVVNAVLLRPLPYPDADRIVQVFQIIERPNVGTPLRGGLTPDQFQIWRDEADAVSQIAVHGVRTFTLTGVAEAVRLNGAAVTPSLFPLLGIAPLIGRTFEPEAAQPGAAPVVILSQATWERYLGSDPAVLDRMLTLEGTPYRVVGVMPHGFDFPALPAAYRDATGALDDLPQFWVPVGLGPPNPNPLRDRDLAGQPPVAVVNDAFARHYFPTGDALGAEFVFLRSPEPIRIVGVVGNTTPAEPDGTVTPELYFSYLQFPSPNPRFSPLATLAGGIRTSGDTRAMASLIRDAVRTIDPELAVHNVATLADRRADAGTLLPHRRGRAGGGCPAAGRDRNLRGACLRGHAAYARAGALTSTAVITPRVTSTAMCAL